MRNNNPGNIDHRRANKWIGEIVPLDPAIEPRFCRFSHMAYGVRACAVLIKNYIVRGDNTCAKIAARWAPSNENNSKAYALTLSSRSGFDLNEALKVNAITLEAICLAIFFAENGKSSLSINSEIIDDGIKAALGQCSLGLKYPIGD